MRQTGLMGLLVPKCYGGMDVSYATIVEVAQVLASECLSTAMIWAMHCQQVAVLLEHAPEPLRAAVLHRIAKEGIFIASVTSERGKGGHLLTALAPLVVEDDDVLLTREAPIVTGGLRADAYLITMRADETSSPSEVVLVYAERAGLQVTKLSDWAALGMRATESVGVSLRGRLPKDHVLNKPNEFKRVAVMTMIPVGHITWAACWLGAASGAFQRVVEIFRDPGLRKPYNVSSDLFAERLARIRNQLDVVKTYLDSVTGEYQKLRHGPKSVYENLSAPGFQIRIKNLKIMASEMLYDAVDRLVDLCGLRYGFLQNDRVPLERILRDLRSATLMFSNERLLLTNGKLAMFETGITAARRTK